MILIDFKMILKLNAGNPHMFIGLQCLQYLW